MITPGQFFRVIAIQRTLIRHGVDEMLLATPLLRSVKFVLRLLPWNWMRAEYAPRAQRIRNVLEDLGPIFVKSGQLLSTRRDLLPDDVAEELAKLTDAVPPFPGDVAENIVERAYGKEIGQVFAQFDVQPLASASIAQVHRATLLGGREVIVKVVRPNIRKTIQSDLGLLHILARTAEKYSMHGRRLRPTGVVAELQKTMLDELDLLREAANATQLKRNFIDSEKMYLPEINWELTRNNVMVMERISGIRIDDREALVAAGVDLQRLAEAGVDLFFTQVFRDHFFHADMHPGNLFVVPGKNGGPHRYAPVDFGIMGSLSDYDQRYLANNFIAFMNRDYRRVAELHVESGWVPKDTRVDDFEFAIRTVCEPMFDRPIKEVSFGRLLLGLFQTAQRFHMKILPQLLLLQKTLVNIEGVARQLHPELDIWVAARPALDRWMQERVSVKRLWGSTRERMMIWADRMPELPSLVLETLDKANSGELEFQTKNGEFTELRTEMTRGFRRIIFAIIGTGCVIGAAVLLAPGAAGVATMTSAPIPIWLLAAGGFVLLGAALRK